MQLRSKPSAATISLSPVTGALLASLSSNRLRESPDEYTKLNVSRAVSFLALMYEKLRNSVEYRESHLLRRAAIERILRRRLALNPGARNKAEQIVRELLWARYFPKNSLGTDDVDSVQHLLDRYTRIRDYVCKGKKEETRNALSSFLIEMLSCEIEETLAPVDAGRERLYTYYLFQTLRDRVALEGVDTELKDVCLFIALEKAYRKSDRAYLRYHLYELLAEPVSQHTDALLEKLLPSMESTFRRIDGYIREPIVDKLVRYGKRQLPPYLILFDILNDNLTGAEEILSETTTLWKEVEKRCIERYAELKKQVRTMTIRSIIYILVLKLIFAVLVEYPISLVIGDDGTIIPIILNILIAPILLVLIVATFRMPDSDNTRRMYDRIIQIIQRDPHNEKRIALVHRHYPGKNRVLYNIFTVLYIVAFGLILYGIHLLLSFLEFSYISQAVFVLFLSVAVFFSHRIKLQINELMVVEREGIMRPLFDFFVIPLVRVGKFFDETMSRFNFLAIIFDFIIEAPFKLIIDIIEEWISFIRKKREDIV
ncbi:MAG: hypothetical protein N2691_03645 [Patescibacteria group bacterium]|nr:hypothetical protein [Patescibacteria group bacterium]